MGGKLVKAEASSKDMRLSQKDVIFLKQVFKHMARRSPKDTMDKETFLQYFPLNGMLGERLFVAFDHKKNGVIDLGEFIAGLTVVLAGTAEEKCRFIYTMFNLDDDDGVSRGELKTMLISMLSSAIDIVRVLGMTPILEEIHDTVPEIHERGSMDSRDSGGRPTGPLDGSHDQLGAHSITKTLSAPSLPTSTTTTPTKNPPQKTPSRAEVNTKPLTASSASMQASSILSMKSTVDHKTLEQIVQSLVDEAFEICDVSRTGKLNYVEFSDWLDKNPAVLDAIFGRECFQQHRLDHLLMQSDREERRGYLIKNVANPLRPWKRRLHVLRGQFLYYYGKENLSQPVGAIYLAGAHVNVFDGQKYMQIRRSNSLERGGTRGPTPGTSPDVPSPIGAQSVAGERDRHRWGIELVSGKLKTVLYTHNRQDAVEWCEAIRRCNQIIDIRSVYEFDEKNPLGKGGFATVYRAIHRQTRQQVAVKVIGKKHLDPVEKEGMLAEIAILKLVNHPNVIDLLEIYDTPDTLYLVMELCTGGEMLALFKKGPMAEQQAVRLIKQLFQGIAYLHDIGIVHRDIKPSNILLSTDIPETQVLKIVDFGFSKFVRPSERLEDPVGTLKYNAPEVINEQAYNKPVDMWSAGIIVYILLTGRFPFIARSEHELVDAITRARFDCTCKEYEALSVDAKNVIHSLLRVDPELRPSAKDMLTFNWFQSVSTPRTEPHNWNDALSKVQAAARKSIDSLDSQPYGASRTSPAYNSGPLNKFTFGDAETAAANAERRSQSDTEDDAARTVNRQSVIADAARRRSVSQSSVSVSSQMQKPTHQVGPSQAEIAKSAKSPQSVLVTGVASSDSLTAGGPSREPIKRANSNPGQSNNNPTLRRSSSSDSAPKAPTTPTKTPSKTTSKQTAPVAMFSLP
eukprot:comp23652_c1_seq1/m.40385 comp23652_c1_seq1/g.40385  ORF comp23652_c1_seq1/g.40385 comp23652_c1_seq1/m.40385 type:complete len:909 (-) comp23652_c1_seq1:101-2827(-)